MICDSCGAEIYQEWCYCTGNNLICKECQEKQDSLIMAFQEDAIKKFQEENK
jgi:hypothetical protein